MKKQFICILFGLTLVAPLAGFAGSGGDEEYVLPEVSAVMGMTPVTINSCLAVWIPVPESKALSGILWYNNDGTVAFPAIFLESGSSGYPVSMSDCTLVAENVFGESLGWSEVFFENPVTCASYGLYVLFVFPEGSEQDEEGAGGGAGFGFVEDGGQEGWMSTDGDNWIHIDKDFGFAVQPVFVDAEEGMVHMNGARPGEVEIEIVEDVVNETGMLPVAPNPFNPTTEIQFALKESDRVVISVFDIRGRKVVDLVDEVYSAGRHSATWQSRGQNGQRVASGIYFARLTVGGENFIRRMMLVK